MELSAGQVVAEVVERVWVQGDLDALEQFFTPECINHAARSTHDRGLAELRAYHEGFAAGFADFDDIAIEVADQLTEGDRVCTRIITAARHSPTGRPVTMTTIRIDRIEGGRIAEHWSVADRAGLAEQLNQ